MEACHNSAEGFRAGHRPIRAGSILLGIVLTGGTYWAQAAADRPDSSAPPQSGAADTTKINPQSSQPGPLPTTGETATPGSPAPSSGPAVKFMLQEQSEAWADLIGGGHQGTSYNGLTTATLDIDLEKIFGWRKARFFVNGFDIHGHGPTRSLVGNNQIVSNIEATPSVKLYDLWLENQLFGVLNLRAGQEGANDEMMISNYAAAYLNSSFGFPGLPAADLPSGGPNYPMATPFGRVRWQATDTFSVTGAVYNGDPAPLGPGDPQIRDRNGTAFRVNGNSLSFAELRYSPEPNAPETLPTAYKLGAWYHSGHFEDRRFDVSGGLLASPSSSRIARMHQGDFAIYGIIDQVLWRREPDKAEGIGVFLQVQAARSDQNLSNLFIEGGANWNGPFHKRPDDVAGLAFAYLNISPAARQFSRDLVALGRATSSYASNETVIEAMYKARISDNLTLQPDAQYVIHPNARIPGSFGPKPLSNALVIGIRATINLGNQ